MSDCNIRHGDSHTHLIASLEVVIFQSGVEVIVIIEVEFTTERGPSCGVHMTQ